jgi:serine/threonine protein kinase
MSKFVNNSENPKNDFEFFIENSKNITYLNKGTFGVAFTLALNDGVPSPYKYENGDEIRKVLLKLVAICSEKNKDTKEHISINNEYDNVETLTPDALTKECELQNKVYNCGKEKGIQLCPKMYYCENIMDKNNIVDLLTKIKQFTGYVEKTKDMFNRMKLYFQKPKPPPEAYIILNKLIDNVNNENMDGLYFSLMEYADGYDTLYRSRIEEKYSYARVALLRLALYCQLSHNDPNTSNILINKDNHVLLIDFGSTIDSHDKEIITDEEKTEIIKNLSTGEYSKALKICNKMYTQSYTQYGEPYDGALGWVHRNVNTGDEIIKNFVTEININKGGKQTKGTRKRKRKKHTYMRKTKNKSKKHHV